MTYSNDFVNLRTFSACTSFAALALLAACAEAPGDSAGDDPFGTPTVDASSSLPSSYDAGGFQTPTLGGASSSSPSVAYDAGTSGSSASSSHDAGTSTSTSGSKSSASGSSDAGNPLDGILSGLGGLLGDGGSAPASSDGGAASGDGGMCANAICFDVFDCYIFHPDLVDCGFTACDGFVCK